VTKLISFEELKLIRSRFPQKKIVHCHGVFDLFHVGHLAHLESAKKWGDLLVVTLTKDQYVNKGPGRPKYSHEQRAKMLASMEIVDFVCINLTPTAIEPIEALKPDFYVKGPDYKDANKDLTGGISKEAATVEKNGGKLVVTEDETMSSTSLLNEFFSLRDEEEKIALKKIKSEHSLSSIEPFINKFSDLKVLVIGEPIVDTYVFCKPDGISSKSPTVSANFMYQEDYAGGSLAIANHLNALGCQTSLLIQSGNESYFQKILESEMHPEIEIHAEFYEGIPTPRKTRFLAPFRSQRMFELTELKSDLWKIHQPDSFISKMISLANKHDVVIIADFGHGLFEDEVLKSLSKINSFKGLNVQTNSSNFGFNVFKKHQHFDYLSIDERELRIGQNDRYQTPEKVLEDALNTGLKPPLSITLGTKGALYLDQELHSMTCPTFFKNVVDTTGAGDAYFAITTLLSYLRAPTSVVPFVGNCYAGLKTQIMGNKKAVSKVDLHRTIQSLLN
tara:strand:+ start:326 stop:1837 length:1512 start_codon:yes stop_codon:yes gene_type:complete